MATTATRSRGKSAFIKEVLIDNPKANATAVNEAWTAAGMEGTISNSLVNKLRSEMGFAGNLHRKKGRKSKTAGQKRGRPAGAAERAVSQSETRGGDRYNLLADMEADIDRLIFKAMRIGSLPHIEESLRETRRLLYGDFAGKRS